MYFPRSAETLATSAERSTLYFTVGDILNAQSQQVRSMSNRVQLGIQLVGLSLAVLTMVMSFTRPVYEKMETLNNRLSVIETQIRYLQPSSPK